MTNESLKPILEQAREVDSDTRRRQVLCDVLFSAMGVEQEVHGGLDQKVEWRGTKR